MPARRTQRPKTERGDESEWSRRVAATRARVEQEHAERGYGAPVQTDFFAAPAEDLPAPVQAEPDQRETPRETEQPQSGLIEAAEAKLTLSWQRHERLAASGIDTQSVRLAVSERKLLDELHAYERLADPAHYEQMRRDGRRP